MRRFQFGWHDSYDEPFVVKAEDDSALTDAFRAQWTAWIEKRMDYPQNKGKSIEELSLSTAEEKLAEDYTIIEVGDPAIKWNPRPVCCERINEMGRYHEKPPIILNVTRRNPDTGDYFSFIDPHWVLRKSGDEVSFCPFCGTKLPGVEKMENPPQPLWDGDDDYCGTCNERNRCCNCNPPWTAYRIKEEI